VDRAGGPMWPACSRASGAARAFADRPVQVRQPFRPASFFLQLLGRTITRVPTCAQRHQPRQASAFSARAAAFTGLGTPPHLFMSLPVVPLHAPAKHGRNSAFWMRIDGLDDAEPKTTPTGNWRINSKCHHQAHEGSLPTTMPTH
jgi:hypothetical protein